MNNFPEIDFKYRKKVILGSPHAVRHPVHAEQVSLWAYSVIAPFLTVKKSTRLIISGRFRGTLSTKCSDSFDPFFVSTTSPRQHPTSARWPTSSLRVFLPPFSRTDLYLRENRSIDGRFRSPTERTAVTRTKRKPYVHEHDERSTLVKPRWARTNLT